MKPLLILIAACAITSGSANANTCIPPKEVIEKITREAENENASCSTSLPRSTEEECQEKLQFSIALKVAEWCANKHR